MSDPNATSHAGRPRPLQPEVVDHGLFIEHNMPCGVCLKNHAVYALHLGVFAPCWDCQEEGWQLKKSPRGPWWAFWR